MSTSGDPRKRRWAQALAALKRQGCCRTVIAWFPPDMTLAREGDAITLRAPSDELVAIYRDGLVTVPPGARLDAEAVESFRSLAARFGSRAETC